MYIHTVDTKTASMLTLRLDYIFSYWMFVLYLLFKVRLVPYTPRIFFACATAWYLIAIVFLVLEDASVYSILKFLVINGVIKILPCIDLWMFHRSEDSTPLPMDAFLTVLLALVYVAYMRLQNQSVFSVYTELHDSYLNVPGTRPTWISLAFDRLFETFKTTEPNFISQNLSQRTYINSTWEARRVSE